MWWPGEVIRDPGEGLDVALRPPVRGLQDHRLTFMSTLGRYHLRQVKRRGYDAGDAGAAAAWGGRSFIPAQYNPPARMNPVNHAYT